MCIRDSAVTDLATCETCVVAERRYYTLVERRTAGLDGRLTIQNRLYESCLLYTSRCV